MHDAPSNEMARRIERLKLACRNTGMRMTHQRIEIFREIAGTEEHPDAETIFKRVRERMPTLSPDTVYRTLASLEEMGLINRANPTCGRARYDANCDTHHHFVCSKCGRMADIYLDKEPLIPEGLENLGHAESLHLQVKGTCHKCKNNQQGV